MIRSEGVAHQAQLAGPVVTGRRPTRPVAVGPPRCSTDAPPPKPKLTRGRKKAAAPKEGDSPAPAAPVTAAAAVDNLDATAMLKLSKADLQALAEAKGVPKSGTKAQIVARILGTEGAAAKTPRAPRKKAVVKEKGEKIVDTEVIAKVKVVEDPARKQAVLEGQAAALAAAAAVVSALNSKRRVLWGQKEALEVAISVSAALNAKQRVLDGQQRAIAAASAAATQGAAVPADRQHETADLASQQQESIKMAQAATQAAGTAWAAPPTPAATAADAPVLPPPGSRRKLSPTEATRVLEEIARRKGAVDAAAAVTAAPALTEVDRAREVMASLRADLEEQERRTQQLQAVIARGAASAQLTARRAVTVAAAEQGEDPTAAATAPTSGSASKKTAPSSSSPAMEFLGAVLVAVGRAITIALSSATKSGR